MTAVRTRPRRRGRRAVRDPATIGSGRGSFGAARTWPRNGSAEPSQATFVLFLRRTSFAFNLEECHNASTSHCVSLAYRRPFCCGRRPCPSRRDLLHIKQLSRTSYLGSFVYERQETGNGCVFTTTMIRSNSTGRWSFRFTATPYGTGATTVCTFVPTSTNPATGKYYADATMSGF